MNKIKNSFLYAICLFFLAFVSFATAATPSTADTLQDKATDAAIIAKINAFYLADKKLSPFEIKVTSFHGAVTLKGKVNTEDEYERAISIAASVDGVKSIHAHNLTISKSHDPMKDIYTTAMVKGLLIREKILDLRDSDAHQVSVTTKNGVVHLSGHVQSASQKERIIKIAHSVDDVKSVNAVYLKVN